MKLSPRQIILFSTLLTAMLSVDGQTIAESLNSRGVITVVQPEALNRRLVAVYQPSATSDSEPSVENAPVKVKAGYRVQVFDDNNVRTAQSEAQSCKRQIESRFPHLSVYVTFSSPYWRVKVGDFRTRGEAEAAMGEIKHAFPAMAKSLRIVRDRINQR